MATIQGYRGYTIWSMLNDRGTWYIYYRSPRATANYRLMTCFENEDFGLMVAKIVIDGKHGHVGPVAA